jgi:hypothetical protein
VTDLQKKVSQKKRKRKFDKRALRIHTLYMNNAAKTLRTASRTQTPPTVTEYQFPSMPKTTKFIPCALDDIPAGVRFDVPGRNQGQIVEVAYGDRGREEHDSGSPYRRTRDRSMPCDPFTYERRIAA